MKIGIIGLGLIGGSLGRAIVKKTSHTVYGSDINASVMLKAELLGAYHHKLDDASICELDVLIIALTPNAFIEEMNKVVGKLKNGAIIMDIAGNKKKIVEAMNNLSKSYPEVNFIATHPMAGREFSGVEHSSITMFDRASLLFVPVSADIEARARLKKLALEIGFQTVVNTTVDEHDKIIAYTSQLAHVVSSSFVKSPTASEHDGFSAGSFRDLTRVAKLNSSMWTELLIDNKDNLVGEIDLMIKHLQEYRDAISMGNESELFELLQEGNERKEIIEKATREWRKNL